MNTETRTWRNYRCLGGCRGLAAIATDGTDLMSPDPDACLIFKGAYYDRAKELISGLE